MTDYSHFNALELGLYHERQRLEQATTAPERELRSVWVQQYEREIASERELLGFGPDTDEPLTLEQIFNELDKEA